MKDNNQGASPIEHGHADPPRSGELMATGGHPGGMAIASPFAPPATHDVISGGMDASTLMHSFRRRWPLAIGMGILAGALGAALLWVLFPESRTAYRYFQVSSTQDPILKDVRVDSTDFDIYRNTQKVFMTSSIVIEAALRELDVDNMQYFKGIKVKDRIRHLQEEFVVNYLQNSELMEVRLTGSANEEELKSIVDAVSKSYLSGVLYNESISNRRPRDLLKQSYTDIDDEIKRLYESYIALAEEKGLTIYPGQSEDPEVRQYHSEMLELARSISKLKSQLTEAGAEYLMQKTQLEDPAELERRIGAAVEADPKYQSLKNMVLAYEMEISKIQAMQSNPRGTIKQYQKYLSSYGQQMEARRQELDAAYRQRHRTEPDPMLKMLRMNWNITQSTLGGQIQQQEKRLQEIVDILQDRGRIDTDLMARSNEIDRLEEVQNVIAQRIEHWDVELQGDKRVVPQGEVMSDEGINTTQRYAISGLGGLTCLGLTAFGLSYLEFLNRKVNGPEQLDQGLGIRVIGTLPSLSSRKSSRRVVSQLTESINGLRTALMHESTTRRRQIVMITSPSTLEGRTTVASQLAASLARAGRRTLLVDGDLRRPNIHGLFDLPLEDGLCEVLRAESDVSDVIRPSHNEGLWVLTAGYCDADAIHALATDQVQPIFDRLRAEYDFIIIDGAPVLGVSDTLLFGQHCDGAILSVLRDQTRLPDIHKAAELLRNVGIRLIGSVVNGMSTKADRRVTALDHVTAKSERKQLESVEA